MSTCSVGEISVVCDGGCGLICTSTHCWSWCEPTPTIVPAIMTLLRGPEARADFVPSDSESLTLCAHELSRSTLVNVLERVVRTKLVPIRENVDEEVEQSFSGTFGELLEHVGVRRDDQRDAAP